MSTSTESKLRSFFNLHATSFTTYRDMALYQKKITYLTV